MLENDSQSEHVFLAPAHHKCYQRAGSIRSHNGADWYVCDLILWDPKGLEVVTHHCFFSSGQRSVTNRHLLTVQGLCNHRNPHSHWANRLRDRLDRCCEPAFASLDLRISSQSWWSRNCWFHNHRYLPNNPYCKVDWSSSGRKVSVLVVSKI